MYGKKLQPENAKLWVWLPCQDWHKESIHIVTGKLGQMSKGNMRRLLHMIKLPLFLQILVVIGRYGRHVMIVMIFVTQNNFWKGPEISDCLLGFYQNVLIQFRVTFIKDIPGLPSPMRAFQNKNPWFCVLICFACRTKHILRKLGPLSVNYPSR